MSPANLANINVDALFEQHNVPEIDIVHKKIQSVVEDKREELRTMVGERYRDLLKAADTIAAMQISAGTLIEQMNSVQVNCRSLNEQQLIGFKTNADSQDVDTLLLSKRNAQKQLNNYYSTMVQIKLLTSLPELIWSHMDKQQFYTATELYIFSRHISTGLQLDAKNPLMQQLPVAQKQWEILRPFHITIKHNVIATLEREELHTDVAVDCLLSLLLLDKCDFANVLETFLQLRCDAFLNSLLDNNKRERTEDQERRRRIKERILISLRVLNGTVELLDKCILENGLLFQRINEYKQSSSPPTIERMDNSDRQLAYLLPEIISSFRPKFQEVTIEPTSTRKALDSWLNNISRHASTKLKQLFALVANMQTIQEIKNEANTYFQHNITERFALADLSDFYTTKYVPLINERVRDIISDNWSTAMQQTLESLKTNASLLTDTVKCDNKRIFWQENSDELPMSLAEALSENLKQKKLLNKIKGYDAAVIELCSNFDERLGGIVNELNVLLQEQTMSVEDKLRLIEFLRETAQTQFTWFIEQVRQIEVTEQAALLFLVRASVALVELCPHLKMCFCQPSNWRQSVGNLSAASGVEHWQRLCALFEEVSLQIWTKIVNGVLEELPLAQQFPKLITQDIILHDFANWHTIELDQKDEEGNDMQSKIRIPSQPRIPLQTYLFNLIRSLNKIMPQTFPTKVLQVFNDKLLLIILEHYEMLSQDKIEGSETSQCVALQLYFDLKFMQNAFGITREGNDIIHEKILTLSNYFRDRIDPIDFELFSEHLTTNIKKSVTRLNGVLGVLTHSSSGQAAQSLSAAVTLTHETDPNVLCLSSSGSSSLWFPFLPIVTTARAGGGGPTSGAEQKTNISETEKQATPTRKTTMTRKSDSHKSKSSGSSFFGMSQEWFR